LCRSIFSTVLCISSCRVYFFNNFLFVLPASHFLLKTGLCLFFSPLFLGVWIFPVRLTGALYSLSDIDLFPSLLFPPCPVLVSSLSLWIVLGFSVLQGYLFRSFSSLQLDRLDCGALFMRKNLFFSRSAGFFSFLWLIYLLLTGVTEGLLVPFPFPSLVSTRLGVASPFLIGLLIGHSIILRRAISCTAPCVPLLFRFALLIPTG